MLFRERHPTRDDPKVDPSHLTHFELGTKAMSSDKVDCLCEVLGLHLAPPDAGTDPEVGRIAPADHLTSADDVNVDETAPVAE